MTSLPLVDRQQAAKVAELRQQFPGLAHKSYFNYGGQGPMPQVALEAIQAAYTHIQTVGPFSGASGLWVMQQADRTRQAIAGELGVSADTISLTEDVTVGCNIALWGLDWQAGDHLLLSDCEHPGVVATAQELQRRFGIEISMCPLQATLNAGDPVAVVTQHLRPQTRLVVLSHLFWNTGQVLPLADIVAACRHSSPHDRPIRVLVDAAQSVGSLPLNLTELGVDFYAFTGHKWWCGPEGVGGLYVRPDALESLSPTFIGWRSIVKEGEDSNFSWQPTGQRFEVATSAYPLYAGLEAAIALHQTWGTAAERYQRICTLSRHLWQQLQDLPGIQCLRSAPPEAGLVSFQIVPTGTQSPPVLHQQLVKDLEKRGFFLRTLVTPSCVRACVHYLTLESEIDHLIAEIHQWLDLSSM